MLYLVEPVRERIQVWNLEVALLILFGFELVKYVLKFVAGE